MAERKKWLVVASILAVILGLTVGFILFSKIIKGENKTVTENKVCIYFFYGETCPHCAKEKIFLNNLKNKYPQIELHSFEIYYNEKNQELCKNIAKNYNITVVSVPLTFVGNEVFIGFAEGDGKIYDSTSKAYIGYSGAIEESIKKYIKSGGVDCPLSTVNTVSSNESTNILYIVGIIVFVIVIYILIKKFKIKFKFKE